MKVVTIFSTSFSSIRLFLRKADFHIRLMLIPFILIIVTIIFMLVDFRSIILIHQRILRPLSLSYTIHQYPTLASYTAPVISAQAAAVYQPDAGVFLYTKNPQIHFSMASTTKLMTALVAIDHYKMDDVLTVKRSSVEGTVLNLYAGEQLTFSNLLYAMLLNSANDAAYTIADNYPGEMTAFVAAMNAKARALNLANTQFIDPAGLEDDDDFTTVKELAQLAGFALQQPTIAQVVDTKYKFITTVNGVTSYQLVNLNQLLGIDGVIGVKTGTTEGAGQVLITAKKINNNLLIMVVMQSTDRYTDTWSILQLVDSQTQFINP